LAFSTINRQLLDSLAQVEPGSKIIPVACLFPVYAVFLYCNFSGYIDVAIGAAGLVGLSLPENFDRPFSSQSFVDFWNRWHITLSTWLRSYVYNPLLMQLMRSFPQRSWEPVWAVVAFFVTFFLIGLWHGRNSEFLFYGLLLGLGVSMNKAYELLMTAWIGRKRFIKLSSNQAYIAAARGLTFTYFSVTLLWFSSSWNQIEELRRRLGTTGIERACALTWLGSSFLLSFWEQLRSHAIHNRFFEDPRLRNATRIAFSTALVVMVALITLLINQAAPDIVYKAF
jgi:D-alanyl-lipoteichoic acid acyltransferase DltB (MBOAT superfamily)